jgi:hypothetical protein
MGGTLFDLVSENGRLRLSVPGQSKEVQTALEELLIREKKGPSFSSELLDVLAGGGQPLMRASEFSAVEQNGTEIILYQFLLNTDGKTRLLRKYWLENDRLLTKRAVYFDPSGRPSMTALYHDYRPIPSPGAAGVSPGGGESFWPREITAVLNGQTRLAIVFREVQLNQPFQAGAFSFGGLSQ